MHSKFVAGARNGEQLSLQRIRDKAIKAVRYVDRSLIVWEDSKDYDAVSVDREL